MASQPEPAAPEDRGGRLPHATTDSASQTDAANAAAHEEPDRSLLNDLEAAWANGKLYVVAELAFQKTRARYATVKLKNVALYGAIAAFVAVLALIGLTVGAIFTLATLVGPLAATLIVVGVLLLAAYILARRAAASWTDLTGAFADEGDEP